MLNGKGIRWDPEGDREGHRLRRRPLRLTGCPARTTTTRRFYVQAQVPPAEPGSCDFDDRVDSCARRNSGCRDRDSWGQEGGHEADQEAGADTEREACED